MTNELHYGDNLDILRRKDDMAPSRCTSDQRSPPGSSCGEVFIDL